MEKESRRKDIMLFKGKKKIDRNMSFWTKVQQKGPSECWPWLASKNKDGYGQFWTGGTFVPSHRYAYMYKHKKIIDSNILICHHCDNPGCCNPNHLFEGTVLDNVRDKVNKRRQANGIQIAHPTLYEGEIWLVRKLKILKSSNKIKRYLISEKTIAKMFLVSSSVIHRIWKTDKYLCKEGYYV